jgi:hypothetical protein
LYFIKKKMGPDRQKEKFHNPLTSVFLPPFLFVDVSVSFGLDFLLWLSPLLQLSIGFGRHAAVVSPPKALYTSRQLQLAQRCGPDVASSG